MAKYLIYFTVISNVAVAFGDVMPWLAIIPFLMIPFSFLMFKFARKASWWTLKQLVIWGIPILLLALIAGAGWYFIQSDERQNEIHDTVRLELTSLRDDPITPIELDRGLDWLIDHIPSDNEASEKSYTQATNISAGAHTVAGMPSGHRLTILENDGYIVGYDEDLRIPRWVAYRLVENSNGRTAERPNRFATDTRTRSRVTHDDYTHSGYDRGHMAPNYAIGMTYGANAQLQTFYMSNIVPQLPSLNRRYWRDLEQEIANDLLDDCDELWIITGPIVSYHSPRLPSGVTVPDGFFKIVIDIQPGNRIRALAFIVDHASDYHYLDSPLTSIDEVEQLTGLDFLELLDDRVEDALEAQPATSIW